MSENQDCIFAGRTDRISPLNEIKEVTICNLLVTLFMYGTLEKPTKKNTLHIENHHTH